MLLFEFSRKSSIEFTLLDLALILFALIGAASYWRRFCSTEWEKIEFNNGKITGPNSFHPRGKLNRIDLSSSIEIKKYFLSTFPFRTVIVKQNDQQVCISEMFFSKKIMSKILDDIQKYSNSSI